MGVGLFVNFALIYAIISLVLKQGIFVDQPVPIPVLPFISNNGKIGSNVFGSIFCPSSYKYSKISLSSLLNNCLA